MQAFLQHGFLYFAKSQNHPCMTCIDLNRRIADHDQQHHHQRDDKQFFKIEIEIHVHFDLPP